MAPLSALLKLSAYAGLLHYAGQASAAAINRRSTTGYAPVSASCPSTSLVRDATSIGSDESTYYTARKANADTALAAWLQKTDSSFVTTGTDLPSVGIAFSGGGYRALLCGAGVIQALDSRDSDLSTSGLFQGLTYQSALSGGAWLTSSFAGNNWPTISTLRDDLWETAFQDSLLVPEELLSAVAYAEIVADIESKALAGFDPTIVDPWGRLLSYQLLDGNDGGVSTTLSGLTSYSNFTSHSVPFPIITARGNNVFDNECYPVANSTQYEFNPYEFGSWDAGVKAFTQTAYLGSSLSNGSPTVSGSCIANYDNLGYILGTSSDVFNGVCESITAQNNSDSLAETLEAIVLNTHDPLTRDLFAPYKNPFYQYSTSTLVLDQEELELSDGGEAGQNDPIWPLIQPYRNVSVILVSDNSADTDDTWPNGTEILTTYQQAQAQGLTKMPYIPSVATFVDQGLNKRATFFGCNDTDVVTIVYLPNNEYTYASNVTTATLEYSKTRTAEIIANGNSIATQGDDSEWATCLGCAVMMKTDTTLPDACTACFETYCYTQ